MTSLQSKLERLKHVPGLISTVRLVFWAAPFVIAGITYVAAMTESLPGAVITTLALVTLAASVTFINQVRILFGAPQRVRFDEDYAYGLALPALSLGLELWNEESALQVGVQLVNCSRQPMAYHVERFDLIIHDRVWPSQTWANRGGVIGTGVGTLFMHPPFPKASISSLIGQKVSGLIEVEIVYGPPNGDPVRKLHKKLQVTLNLIEDKSGASFLTLIEADSAL